MFSIIVFLLVMVVSGESRVRRMVIVIGWIMGLFFFGLEE